MKKIFKYLSRIILIFIITSLGLTIIYRYVPVSMTPLMAIRRIENTISNDQKKKSNHGILKKWVPLKSISKNMIKAVIRAEDHKFYDHFGFDFEAIEKAIEYNKKHKTKKGASTISQQTAKNVFLWPSRNYLRKGLEVYFTILIELFWPKERILEVYLNVIEFGPEVYGVEASAQKYFKKSASRLTRHEAALMAAVLPNPIKFRIDRPSSFVLKRQNKILGKAPIAKISDGDVLPVKLKEEKVVNEDASLDSSADIEQKPQEFFDIKFQDEQEGPEEQSGSEKGPDEEKSSGPEVINN